MITIPPWWIAAPVITYSPLSLWPDSDSALPKEKKSETLTHFTHCYEPITFKVINKF